MGKTTWTFEMESQLALFYEKHTPMKEMCEWFHKKPCAISSKAMSMGLTQKYPKSNAKNFTAPYQNYDWCYEHYIVKGMSLQQMADELGCQKRVVQKWCTDKFGLHRRTAKFYIQPNSEQHQIILAGTLGDGHISARDNIYIESHAQDEKDYLFWKYEKLQNLCVSSPTYYPEKLITHLGGPRIQQPYYRFETRKIQYLEEIKSMSISDKIRALTSFGLCLYMLDDGSRNHSNWILCTAKFSPDETALFVKVMQKNFSLSCRPCKDSRYIIFDADSSRKLDNMILSFLPQNLDIIHKKIFKDKDVANAELP